MVWMQVGLQHHADYRPRIDTYISNAAEFAQPILNHLRKVVHATCPEVEETIKWGIPHFMYQGMLCNMAGFKAHCTFGFWKGKTWIDEGDLKATEAMGQFGRIASIKDLPPDKKLAAYIKKAMQLNTDPIEAPPRPRPAAPRELIVPDYFLAALKVQKSALATFNGFTPSQRREYVDWLEEAKTEATRLRRMEQAVLWLSEGKKRHWKYEKC